VDGNGGAGDGGGLFALVQAAPTGAGAVDRPGDAVIHSNDFLNAAGSWWGEVGIEV
jgi:hypothetical protein